MTSTGDTAMHFADPTHTFADRMSERIRHLARVLVVVFVSANLGGCYRTVLQPTAVVPDGARSVTVTIDGREFVLQEPRIVGDTVIGWRHVPGEGRVETMIPATVEVRELDAWSTTWAVVGGMIVGGLAIAAVASYGFGWQLLPAG